jgi:DNA-binding response OmpR family regulator
MSKAPAHILVIDDNEDILFMLKAMLQFKGYKVSMKETAADLESSVRELLPDIILMDMLLSGSDGREVCKYMKSIKAFSNIPIVMISAHPQAKTECLNAGADAFLAKPFEMNDLFDTVTNALATVTQ